MELVIEHVNKSFKKNQVLYDVNLTIEKGVHGLLGANGSGKTTLMKNLIARFQDDVTVLSHDNYYRPYDELTIEERRKLNYDHPDAFDTDMMIGHLKELKAGHSIECPVYDYATYSRTNETVTVEPRKVILVEGILIFENHALCDQRDIKSFVDTAADVRLIRRIRRDVAKRGRSLDSVLGQYLATVKPMHEQFVEPSKKNADLVVLVGCYIRASLFFTIPPPLLHTSSILFPPPAGRPFGRPASLPKKSLRTFSPSCFRNCKINSCSIILQFHRCGGLFDAKGHPDGYLSHFSSLRNF